MFNRFERMVALRYLKARRGEGFVSVVVTFSVLGIMLGVGTLIVVMAVMKGFRIELMDRILGINAHVSLVAYQDTITDYPTLTESLSQIKGITAALPSVDGQALVSAGGVNVGAEVRGYQKQDMPKLPFIAEHIRAGSLEQFEGRRS
jgi:lipoprotein-releasing system permease protein